MKDGFIQMPRAIQDSWIWNNGTPFDTRSAWEYIVMNAYWADCEQDTMFGKQTYKRGQYPTSTRKLSESWGWSQSKVNRFINRLESEGMLTRKKTKCGSVLTIVNYGVYQGERLTNDSPSEENLTHERLTDRIGNDSQMTQQRLTNDSAMTHEKLTIKEDKENNNINNIQENEERKEEKKETRKRKKSDGVQHKYGEYQHVLLTDAQYQSLIEDFGEEQVSEMIKILDEGIQRKGYKYKDFNLTLRGWVLREYNDRHRSSFYQNSYTKKEPTKRESLFNLLNEIREEESHE